MAGPNLLENPNGVLGLAKTRHFSASEFQNGDTVTLTAGNVVLLQPGAAGDVLSVGTAPTAAQLRSQIGVLLDTITAAVTASYTAGTGAYVAYKGAQTGRVVTEGYVVGANVTGTVAVGDLMQASTVTAGSLVTNNTATIGQVIGVAMSANTGTLADVWIVKI